MKRIFSIFSVVLATVAMTPSCTNLESEMYDVINPGIFPVNGDDANASARHRSHSPSPEP